MRAVQMLLRLVIRVVLFLTLAVVAEGAEHGHSGRISLPAKFVPYKSESMSFEQEMAWGKTVFEERKKRWTAWYKTDPVITPYLQSLTERLMAYVPAYAERVKPRIQLINQPFAEAGIGGTPHILIFTGLLAQLESEEQLAGILAHEIAHVVLRHSLAIYEMQQQDFNSNAYREMRFRHELEADLFAVHILTAAGISADPYAEFFRSAGRGKFTGMDVNPHHHDTPHARVARIQQEAKVLAGIRGKKPMWSTRAQFNASVNRSLDLLIEFSKGAKKK